MTTHTITLPDPLASLAIEHGVVLVPLDEDVQSLLKIAPAGFFPSPDPRRCPYQPGDWIDIRYDYPEFEGPGTPTVQVSSMLGPIASVESRHLAEWANDGMALAERGPILTAVSEAGAAFNWHWLIRMESGE